MEVRISSSSSKIRLPDGISVVCTNYPVPYIVMATEGTGRAASISTESNTPIIIFFYIKYKNYVILYGRILVNNSLHRNYLACLPLSLHHLLD